VYLLSYRYEALDVFKRFIADVETQSERRAKKILQTDQDCEYLSNMFKVFYEEKGIQWQLTVPHTPRNKTVLLNVEIEHYLTWLG